MYEISSKSTNISIVKTVDAYRYRIESKESEGLEGSEAASTLRISVDALNIDDAENPVVETANIYIYDRTASDRINVRYAADLDQATVTLIATEVSTIITDVKAYVEDGTEFPTEEVTE